MTDWNPTDPDVVRVCYDLSAWSFDHQGELAGELADAEIPHAWDGAELMVPEEHEQAADLIIADVEGRLGIESGPTTIPDEAPEPREPIALADDASTTEYDLAEWPEEDVAAVTHALTGAGIPFRWEGTLLLVGTDDEEVVDDLLDEIELGEYVDTDADEDPVVDGDGTTAPPETLTTFFLAGERLQRDPLDADGLEQLIAATSVADPAHPPFGVQPRLWQQACELAERIVDALTADDGPDHDGAMEAATELHDLLRPTV